jgi:AhpD family alkylhydroperoxidase
MTSFPIHSIDTAPEGSRDTLRHVRKTLGSIPSLAAAMAESPTLLRGFFGLRETYSQGTLTSAEIHVLSLANAFENECSWCMAFHTFMALKEGVSEDDVAALRAGEAPSEPRLRALSELSRSLVRGRGKAGEDELRAFHDAGFSPAQALEVVLGIAFSTMANYTGHFADAPLDEPFKRHAWTKPSRQRSGHQLSQGAHA